MSAARGARLGRPARRARAPARPGDRRRAGGRQGRASAFTPTLYRAGVSDEPHSAAYFGPERDFWWNHDHLRLIGARRALRQGAQRARRRLGRRPLGPADRDGGRARRGDHRRRARAASGSRRPRAARPTQRFRYVEGVAEALPFDDATFDLVTCQTVLIHVADPRAVIREFVAGHQARRAGDRRRAQQPRLVPRRLSVGRDRPARRGRVRARLRAREDRAGRGRQLGRRPRPGLLRRGGADRDRDVHGRQARDDDPALRVRRRAGARGA